LNIVVCVKQTPDTAATVSVEDGKVTWGDAPLVLNPWDEFAVEQALRTKEAHGGKVTAVSLGPEGAREALKQALAMGCDEAILLNDPAFASADTLVVSAALAGALRKLEGLDLAFFGRQAVDSDTGEITVEKITGAHDCGFAINITQVEGQMHGSMMMGMGEALMEQIIYDKKGRILNANLAEYKIPTAVDMPSLEAIIIESNEPHGPYGAKEVGEGAIMPVIPSILNAIYDATGVRIDELPVTPERLVAAKIEALEKQENKSQD